MTKGKTKKIIGIILGILIILIIFLGVAAWTMFGRFITSAQSIDKIDDGLYSMEFRGDYGFDDFLAQGGAESDSQLASFIIQYLSHGFFEIPIEVEEDYGCSTLLAQKEDGGVIFGRNFDWKDGKVMLIHTVPKNGYESTCTTDLEFLGFGEDYLPDASMAERVQTLAAIYVPLDGMNEKGLMVADLMAGDKETTHQKTEKPDLTTTTAIRLVLDKAANVEEAIDLLSQYDMNSSIGSAHHLSIADATGNNVVVEYVNGEMIVTPTKVVTNHYLGESEKKGTGSNQSHVRYDRLTEWLGSGENANAEQMKDLMESVAQHHFRPTEGNDEITLWSMIYDPADLSGDLYLAEDFTKQHNVKIGEKGVYIQ